MGANGGHICLSKHWTCYILQHIGYVERKGTTKVTLQVDNFAELKSEFFV